jgi:hypothetical protein
MTLITPRAASNSRYDVLIQGALMENSKAISMLYPVIQLFYSIFTNLLTEDELNQHEISLRNPTVGKATNGIVDPMKFLGIVNLYLAFTSI